MCARVTDGGRLLESHIKARGETIHGWCHRHGIERVTVSLIISGKRHRAIPTGTTLKIVRAVEADGGYLPWHLFADETSRPTGTDG